MSENMELSALFEEQKFLREEIILVSKGFIQAAFAVVTLSGAMGGILWDSRIIPNEETRAKVLFLLSQIEVFVFLVLILLLAHMGIHAAYCAILEERIQQVSGTRMSQWERVCSPNYLWSLSCPFLWAAVFLTVMLISLFLVSLAYGFRNLNSFSFVVVVVVESIALLIMVGWTKVHQGRAGRELREKLLPEVPESCPNGAKTE